MAHQDWKGQNIPHVIKEFDGSSFSILPVLECFLKYKKDKIDSLLPSADSYGWAMILQIPLPGQRTPIVL